VLLLNVLDNFIVPNLIISRSVRSVW